MATKRCTCCALEKSHEDFYRDRNRRDGLRGKCKACVAKDNAKWYQNGGKEIAKANQRRRIATDPDFRARRRDRMLRAKFGITLADFRELLALQDDLCAICRTAPERPDLWHVDHDHTTGHIRGILCGSCNRGLGYFRDDITRLNQATEYLDHAERHALIVGHKRC